MTQRLPARSVSTTSGTHVLAYPPCLCSIRLRLALSTAQKETKKTIVDQSSLLARTTGPSAAPESRLRFLVKRLLGLGLGAVTFYAIGLSIPLLRSESYRSAMADGPLNGAHTPTPETWQPTTTSERAHDEHLSAHPTVLALRADPALTEYRPHLQVPRHLRANNLTAGVLMGEDRVPFPPVAWLDAEGPERRYVQIGYAGRDLCGHPGIVHGGFLATVLDEGLARVAFAALPSGVGVTASLTVNYKAPCVADQYVVLRAELQRAEGRKAWVEGRIETLPGAGEEPLVLATATALYIEPKNSGVSACPGCVY